jgi:hypothetical protein
VLLEQLPVDARLVVQMCYQETWRGFRL